MKAARMRKDQTVGDGLVPSRLDGAERLPDTGDKRRPHGACP